MRTVLGIIIGYLVFVASAVALFRAGGVDPHAPATAAFVIGSVAYGMIFAALGGAIAVAVGRRGPLPALVVGGIIAVGALASIVAMRGRGVGALWSPIAALVLMAPSAAIGGIWRTRRAQHPTS